MLRVGTRGSQLALVQARAVVAALAERGERAELVIVRTRGDADVQSSLSAIGRGAFTDVFSEMIARGELDLAVHSAKDLPTDEGHDAFFCLPRADARDALVTLPGRPVRRVGTGSPRRAAAVQRLLPGAEVVPVRGNVDTRLKKLEAGEVDALVLACAGLDRLGRAGELTLERLSPAVCVPAACQGIIAIEGAAGALVHDEETGRIARIERMGQRLLGGDCTGGAGFYFDGTTLFAQREGVIVTAPYRGEASVSLLAGRLS